MTHVENNSSGKSSKLKKTIVLLVVLLVVVSAVQALYNVGRNQDYAPTQPIPFSHKLHAGQMNMPCMYCHVGVERSKHAMVPSLNICMNCHAVVKPDSPHIKKIAEAYKTNKEMQWVKVHDMPDFVKFSHKRHVLKGVACETCHGDIKKMDVVKQDQPMSMGWCLDCHRGKTTPDYLLSKEEFSKNHPRLPGVDATGVAPTSCYTCHQ